MQKYLSNSEEETKAIAANIAKQHKSNIYALTGELGAGKTTFVQGFAAGLGIKDKIISPTFVLIRQHQIPGQSKILYHIDLYRLDPPSNLHHLGINEIISNQDNIVLIEWAEKYPVLPKTAISITIKKLKTNQRMIIIE